MGRTVSGAAGPPHTPTSHIPPCSATSGAATPRTPYPTSQTPPNTNVTRAAGPPPPTPHPLSPHSGVSGAVGPPYPTHLPITSENMGSFLAKSTTRVMAGVMIFVNSLNASRSTLSPSGMEAMGD